MAAGGVTKAEVSGSHLRPVTLRASLVQRRDLPGLVNFKALNNDGKCPTDPEFKPDQLAADGRARRKMVALGTVTSQAEKGANLRNGMAIDALLGFAVADLTVWQTAQDGDVTDTRFGHDGVETSAASGRWLIGLMPT